jgi:hypothetical protein
VRTAVRVAVIAWGLVLATSSIARGQPPPEPRPDTQPPVELPPVELPPEDFVPPLPPEPPPPVPEPFAPPPQPVPQPPLPEPPPSYGLPTAVAPVAPATPEQRGLETPGPMTPVGFPVCVEPRDDPWGAARRPTGDGVTRCQRGLTELIELYYWAGIFGLSAGAFFSVALGWDDEGGGPLLLGTLGLAGGILGTYALDQREAGLVPGVPASISTGLLVGLLEGVLFTATFLDPGGDATGPAIALGSALAGGGIAAALALHTEPTVGDALLVRTGAFWGLALGFMLGFAATDLEEDEALPWILGGFNIGLAATVLIAREEDPSPIRVLWLNLGGLVGFFAGAVMVAATGDPELGPGHFALWGIGTIGGLGLTWVFTADDDQAP